MAEISRPMPKKSDFPGYLLVLIVTLLHNRVHFESWFKEKPCAH